MFSGVYNWDDSIFIGYCIFVFVFYYWLYIYVSFCLFYYGVSYIVGRIGALLATFGGGGGPFLAAFLSGAGGGQFILS